tara:strand:+ start:4133 stop:4693 length:561 start_codon:yes stop_codon:yes gene_type:complete
MQKNDDFSIRYLMREMDPSEEIEFEREMMNDENLLIEVESLRKTYQKLGKLPIWEPPPDLATKIASDAIKARREQLKRSNRWTSFMSRSVAAAAIAILIISTTIYFSNGQAYTQTDTIETTGITKTIKPWVDRSNNLHFAGTSIQSDNSQTLQLEVDQSYSKLKLINSETGFAPSTRKIVLTSSSR